MAIMIPGEGPRDFDPASREGLLYDSLSRLSDDYYVVHSYALLSTSGGTVEEHEADFVVFNPSLGMLCIEAKAGQVSYSRGCWRYASGLPMRHGGPYRQAANMMYRIIDRFNDMGLRDELRRCKLLHAVWFPSVWRSQMRGQVFPPEASIDITLFEDDIDDVEPGIRRILSMETAIHNKTALTRAQAEEVLGKVLCPEFTIVPTRRFQYDLTDSVFARLLEAQVKVLDFMAEQKTAAINGAAGTGKTLVAMEHARRVASRDGKVLFLCFNARLKEAIANNLADHTAIEVFSIAGYACHVLRTPTPDYEGLGEYLLDCCAEGTFPYKHVVVDEGQDFGIADIDDADILGLLRDAALSREGTFYVFYDRNQFVQGSHIPSVINDADCKLTLYVNCRNTQSIAECASKSIGIDPGRALTGAQTYGPPLLFCSEDARLQAAFVDREIAALRDRNLDVVILTCKREETSCLSNHMSKGGDGIVWTGTKVPVTTCRKFKGLESDAVILVDVDEDVWAKPTRDYQPDPGLMFYTGASRARHELRIVCDMNEKGCEKVLASLGVKAARKPVSKLAKQLRAINVSL